MNHEKVVPKMSVTSNEWKHKHSAAIRKSPKWIDLKHEKGAYGRKQRVQSEKSLTWKSINLKRIHKEERKLKKCNMKKV